MASKVKVTKKQRAHRVSSGKSKVRVIDKQTRQEEDNREFVATFRGESMPGYLPNKRPSKQARYLRRVAADKHAEWAEKNQG
jgi:hypothetical protein